MASFTFPNDFTWGISGSAYQFEGAMLEDGKTESTQEYYFYHQDECPYSYQDTRSPEVKVDFYHHYPDDIKLFRELGATGFRFSFSWPRICPDQSCTPNPKAIAYYNDLIDRLLAAGITPFFDIWHNDIPMWMLSEGGIAGDKFYHYFTTYAKICFENFGDRVKLWSTMNEPKLNVYGVYSHGHAAPFIKDEGLAMKATTNAILAHFECVRMLREMWPDAKIGSVHNYGACYSMSFDEADVAAAERHQSMQLLLLDPMMRGVFPEKVLSHEETAKFILPEYREAIQKAFVPMDFYGINYYSPGFIKSGSSTAYGTTWFEAEVPQDAYGFKNYASGLFDSLCGLSDRYPNVPVYVTENGYTYRREDVWNTAIAAFQHDPERINYVREHLRACSRAIRAGVNLKGYYYWSAMDCWESSMGYGYPMGLIGVDLDTLERFPRDSYYYYQKVIAGNRVD